VYGVVVETEHLYHLSALNLEDLRIAEGLQISFRVMQKMNEYAIARNIRLLVVLSYQGDGVQQALAEPLNEL
jgi:hypothetical protein